MYEGRRLIHYHHLQHYYYGCENYCFKHFFDLNLIRFYLIFPLINNNKSNIDKGKFLLPKNFKFPLSILSKKNVTKFSQFFNHFFFVKHPFLIKKFLFLLTISVCFVCVSNNRLSILKICNNNNNSKLS